MTGKKQNPPFDSYPTGFDPSKAYHIQAWQIVLPNFIHQGQMWSRDRYTTGWRHGRHCVGLKGDPIEWLEKPYPPEEETAQEFSWTPELTAEWRNLARKLSNRTSWYSGPPPRGPAGGWIYV